MLSVSHTHTHTRTHTHTHTHSLKQVIQDMRDEIVDGVLKKGYLTKKGHKRRNWKRRWFVLQRTVMRYYESRESHELKVSKQH